MRRDQDSSRERDGLLTGHTLDLEDKFRELEQKKQQVQETTETLRERYSIQVQRLDRTLSSLERISHALTTTTQGVTVLLQTIVKTVAEVFDCPFVFLVVKNGYKELCAIYPPLEAKSDNDQAEILEQRWCLTEQTLIESGSMRVNCMASENCPCVHIRNIVTVPMSRDGILEGSI